jgi:hypothetical protein
VKGTRFPSDPSSVTLICPLWIRTVASAAAPSYFIGAVWSVGWYSFRICHSLDRPMLRGDHDGNTQWRMLLRCC